MDPRTCLSGVPHSLTVVALKSNRNTNGRLRALTMNSATALMTSHNTAMNPIVTLKALVRTAAVAGGCKLVQVDVVEPFPATVNDHRRSSIVVEAAALTNPAATEGRELGWSGDGTGLDVLEMDTPFPWSEDFGWFGATYPKEGAVLFGLGSGQECPPLHSKTYDFPDALIPVGVELWGNIAKRALL
jgi:metal-dependent amidase/aminoacylase/carboxypeptidase family protein